MTSVIIVSGSYISRNKAEFVAFNIQRKVCQEVWALFSRK